MSFEDRLVRCWHARLGWCWGLLPLSLLFAVVSQARRLYYRYNPPMPLPVPVVVVGNISTGGTGKTPLVIWLVGQLIRAGRRPGVISRGYGAAATMPTAVGPDSDPAQVGDEPVLIARRGGCPVWIGGRRREVAMALLLAHPEVDVIVSDDGLQHYALAREVEIAVIDAGRGFGNGLLLPAGPLREGRRRLAAVDAVVINGAGLSGLEGLRVYTLQLVGGRIYNLRQPERIEAPAYFATRPVHAVAAIGNPSRFFESLGRLGIPVFPHAFPDHHRFSPDELPSGIVLMTEKDAVKCAAFGRDDLWVYAVDAEVSEGLERQILAKLEPHHG